MNSIEHRAKPIMDRGIIDYLQVIVRRRREVLSVWGAITLLSIIIVLLIPNKYDARTSLMPPIEESTDLLSAGMGTLKSLAGGVSGLGKISSLPGLSTPSDVFAAMLRSETVMGKVICKCDLLNFYKLQKTAQKNSRRALELAFKELDKNTKIKVGTQGIILVTVMAKNSQKSADIANAYAEALDEYNKTSSMTKSRRTREFIGKRLDEEKQKLMAAEDSLKVFQKANKTISMGDEAKALIGTIAGIESQIASEELNREIAMVYSTEDAPNVVLSQTKINKLRQQLNKMQVGGGSFIPLNKTIDITVEIMRFTRQIKIKEQIVILLSQQYEQERINETRDTPTIQVLDRAEPPARKCAPKRAIIVLFAFVVGFIFAVISAVFTTFWDARVANSVVYHEFITIIDPVMKDISVILRNVNPHKR